METKEQAKLIAKETDAIDKVDSDLTLEGLKMIYYKNVEWKYENI